MTCWAVIPVKPLARAKMRLSNVLTAEQRQRLSCAMLNHVGKTVRASPAIDEVSLAEDGDDLNSALQNALGQMPSTVTRVVVLPGDLPQLTAQDVRALAGVDGMAVAPDRHGNGTNALSLPMPAANGFTFSFGPNSFALHRAEAARLGLMVQVITRPGLARDVDVEADLPDAAALDWENFE